MKNILTFEEFLNESAINKSTNESAKTKLEDYTEGSFIHFKNGEVNEASQPKFEVGKKYKHDKFGEFVVIELMPNSTTRVQFKKEPKGETSIIAGYGSDGYPEVK